MSTGTRNDDTTTPLEEADFELEKRILDGEEVEAITAKEYVEQTGDTYSRALRKLGSEYGKRVPIKETDQGEYETANSSYTDVMFISD